MPPVSFTSAPVNSVWNPTCSLDAGMSIPKKGIRASPMSTHRTSARYSRLSSSMLHFTPHTFSSPSCELAHSWTSSNFTMTSYLVFKSPVAGLQKDCRLDWTGLQKDWTTVAILVLWQLRPVQLPWFSPGVKTSCNWLQPVFWGILPHLPYKDTTHYLPMQVTTYFMIFD